ncbi:MAG: hypothetical protein A3205_06755 [Methanomassiliicoccales archaeon Mx-03]|nr:MAG: hypothetical protein A3205_06755 [Methanomassiliicoccales archaeon Mx-03]
MSATMSECPRTVVLGMRGVLAQRCWNLSCPMRSMKSKVSSVAMISLTPMRSVCCSICSLISLRVPSIP